MTVTDMLKPHPVVAVKSTEVSALVAIDDMSQLLYCHGARETWERSGSCRLFAPENGLEMLGTALLWEGVPECAMWQWLSTGCRVC